MPLYPHPSVRACVGHVLGGEALLGKRITDLGKDLEVIATRGISRSMAEHARVALEFDWREFADLLEVPAAKFYPRTRPPKGKKEPKPVFQPGEESMRLLRVAVIHGYEARRWRLTGLSAEGISRPVLFDPIPGLGARGLDLARTAEGADQVVEWILSRPEVRWPSVSLITITASETASGREEHYPKRPQPWQHQNKDRIERGAGAPVQLNG